MKPGTPPPARRKRSIWHKLLLAGLLGLSLSGWLRLYQSINLWADLQAIGLQPGPLYLAVSGGLIGLAGLAAALSLWLRTRQAARLAGGVVAAWLAWNWIDKLWIASSPLALDNWPFALAASLLLLVYTFLVVRQEERLRDEQRRTRD